MCGRRKMRVMRVKVRYFGFIKNMINRETDEFELQEGSTLSGLLDRLTGIYGKPFEKEVYESGLEDLKSGFVVTVNGILMGQLQRLGTELKDGDSVVLMSLMTGG